MRDTSQEPPYRTHRRLRIAMVAPPWYELPPRGYGGLEVIVAALVDGLVDRGHEVTLFGAGTNTGTRARFVSTDAEPQHLRLGELMPSVLHTARVNQLIAGGDFHVVHDHTADGPMTAPYRAAPTVVTVHGPVDGEFGDYFAALGGAVRLVAISQAQRSRRPGLAWTATVHNALPDGVTGRADVGLRAPDAPVLWLARFTPDKGPDLAIEACRAAGVPLVLAGKCSEAPERRYFADVIRPMLHDGVELVINAERARTQDLLRRARCLIMPIRWAEPFGMVMIEAMAMGTPVVGLRHGAVPELVRHGVTGWLCNVPAELPELLRRVGELDPLQCVRHVRTNFGAALMARRYELVYLDTLARPQPVAARRHQLAGQPADAGFGPVPVGSALAGSAPVGPAPTGSVPVGPVPVGLVPVGPAPAGPKPVAPRPVAPVLSPVVARASWRGSGGPMRNRAAPGVHSPGPPDPASPRIPGPAQ